MPRASKVGCCDDFGAHDLRISATKNDLFAGGPVEPLQRETCEKATGTTCSHLGKLQEWADKHNTVLIIRKSEMDTVNLIRDGSYATKSVDVHDKSSNWGPHRGTVPFDRALPSCIPTATFVMSAHTCTCNAYNFMLSA